MKEFFIKSFQTFYGLDFAAMIFSLLSIYCLGNKKKIGFIFGLFANAAWIMTNFLAGILAGILLNIILINLNIRGFFKWKKIKK